VNSPLNALYIAAFVAGATAIALALSRRDGLPDPIAAMKPPIPAQAAGG
jgi:hypothetical protein